MTRVWFAVCVLLAIAQIVPGTFASAMRYIEAMRRQARGLALARERQTSSGGVHLKFFSSDGQNDYGA